ncbi:unnamed protein product [Anisakis simplex]|uniref:Protein TSSC4 n=1 Tax=Anisakis simplex TaxID=6269 RepID=A0A0M3J8G4_ANISI|nr:unnamed protein product [Anisakis simplex]
MSIRETSMKGSSKGAECSYGDESKSDVVERFSNVFARRARDLQRDTWSDSAKSSSDESDEFIDVDDPVMPIADADTKTDSEATTTTDQQISAPHNTAASTDDPVTKEPSPINEDWMPDYVHEFGRKEGKEYESRVVRTDEDIEREEEGVYKECQVYFRISNSL